VPIEKQFSYPFEIKPIPTPYDIDNSASIYEVKIAKKFFKPKLIFVAQSKSQNNLPGIILATSPEVKPIS